MEHTQSQAARRALLVEDSEVIQFAHRCFLEMCGFQVDIAADGYRALELAGQSEYDCMLLDIGLPDVSGECVLAAIRYREHQTGKHLPIIVNTAQSDENLFQRCRDKGADAVLEKPTTPERLRDILASAIQSSIIHVGHSDEQ